MGKRHIYTDDQIEAAFVADGHNVRRAAESLGGITKAPVQNWLKAQRAAGRTFPASVPRPRTFNRGRPPIELTETQIVSALTQTGGRRDAAAGILGISRTTMRRRLSTMPPVLINCDEEIETAYLANGSVLRASKSLVGISTPAVRGWLMAQRAAGRDFPDKRGRRPIELTETQIAAALAQTGGRRDAAAGILGISRTTMRRRLTAAARP
jgi:DNA-binding NtrC family response regulator